MRLYSNLDQSDMKWKISIIPHYFPVIEAFIVSFYPSRAPARNGESLIKDLSTMGWAGGREAPRDNTVGISSPFLLIPISLKGQGGCWNLETKSLGGEGRVTETVS